MHPTSLLTSLLLSFSISSATPLRMTPRAKTYPEVIPGPGLPSLASLGLTSEMLYEMPRPSAPLALNRRNGVPDCGPSDDAYTDVNDIIACYHYLNSLGHQNCAVPNYGISQFCRAGSGQAIGQSLTGNPESSWW